MPAAALDLRWISLFADVPAAAFDRARDFWSAITGWPAGDPSGEREERVALHPPRGRPQLWLQRVDEGPGGWHPDLHVPDVEVATANAAERGAAVVRARDELVTLTTPAGQPFCFVVEGEQPIGASGPRVPGGEASVVDQICFDLPAADFDRDADFWAELTGWPRVAGEASEFCRLPAPADVAIKILLQRLGPDDARVRAHADLACADRSAELARHVGLGAVQVGEGTRWTALRDPTGLIYCITDHQPQ